DRKGTSPENDEQREPTDHLVTPDDPEAREYRNQLKYDDHQLSSSSQTQENAGDPAETSYRYTYSRERGAHEETDKAIDLTADTLAVVDPHSTGYIGHLLEFGNNIRNLYNDPSGEHVFALIKGGVKAALVETAGRTAAVAAFVADIFVWSMISSVPTTEAVR